MLPSSVSQLLCVAACRLQTHWKVLHLFSVTFCTCSRLLVSCVAGGDMSETSRQLVDMAAFTKTGCHDRKHNYREWLSFAQKYSGNLLNAAGFP